MRYAIYGIGGLGRDVAPLAQELCASHNMERKSDPVVFVDDASDRPSSCIGLPVISFDELASDRHSDRLVAIAIGDSRIRSTLTHRCRDAGLEMGFLTALSARFLGELSMKAGSIFCDFTLAANAVIGESFHCNVYAYVSHDCVIGDFVTFAPKVCCNGNVHIDDHAYIGTGAILRQGELGNPLKIGRGAVVGQGAVVLRDVEPYTAVVGNPAKVLKQLPVLD